MHEVKQTYSLLETEARNLFDYFTHNDAPTSMSEAFRITQQLTGEPLDRAKIVYGYYMAKQLDFSLGPENSFDDPDYVPD